MTVSGLIDERLPVAVLTPKQRSSDGGGAVSLGHYGIRCSQRRFTLCPVRCRIYTTATGGAQ